MRLDRKRQEQMQIKSPAKINPYLRILRRMDDGTHEIDLALVSISLYDELEIRRMRRAGIALTVESAQPLGRVEDNLVHRAAQAFERLIGNVLDVRIHLIKHIPAGAGLGGGSGDAAATLIALNAMYGRPLTCEMLTEAARGLGADVPFFLDPAPCRAQGRGERLSKLVRFPALAILVVQPPFSISTREAYRGVTSYSPAGRPPAMSNLREVLEGMENQFEASLFSAHPELGHARTNLLDAGAAGALLSGSGSALFGVFADITTRDRAAEKLRLAPGWRVFSCETLAGHDYLNGG